MRNELAIRNAVAIPAEEDLFKRVAMDVGKAVATYIEVMYPESVEASSSTFLLSVRNTVYNEIIGVMKANGNESFEDRLKRRAAWRKEWKAAYKRIRKRASPHETLT